MRNLFKEISSELKPSSLNASIITITIIIVVMETETKVTLNPGL